MKKKLKFFKLEMTWLGKNGFLLTNEPVCLENKKVKVYRIKVVFEKRENGNPYRLNCFDFK